MSHAKRLSAQITLKPRDTHFEIAAGDPKFWHGGDPGRTLIFNALSVMFPLGERFFMDAVRAFRDEIADPRLRVQARLFLHQEALHTREHVAYNAGLKAQGFRVDGLEAKLARRLNRARRQGPRRMLALTCALEHLTAIFAARALADPRVFAGAHSRYRAMWLWHAIEEAEHKGVAFDVRSTYAKGLNGYLERGLAMIAASSLFLAVLFEHLKAMIGDLDRKDRRRAWRGALTFLLLRPGFLLACLPAYAAYYLPGFHPWRDDNRTILADREHELASVMAS